MSARVLLTLSLAVGLVASCAKDACKSKSAAFELDLSVPASARSAASISIRLDFGGARYMKSFDVTGKLADGATSIAVTVDDPPTGSFVVDVFVQVFAEAGGAGRVLAAGGQSFHSTGDACNKFEIALAEGLMDGGAGDAAMADANAPDAPNADATPLNDAEPSDGGVDLDAPLADASLADAAPDAGPGDSGAPMDAATPDALPIDASDPVCAQPLDPTVVALYRFDADAIDTSSAAHDGTIVGNTATFGPGRAGCGSAISFSPNPNVSGYVRVAGAADLSLAAGSIDFYLREPVAVPNRAIGVISRDSAGTVAGSLTVWVSCSGVVIAKLEGADGNPHYRCSAGTVAPGAWAYVGINFGAAGFELFVDGVRGDRSGAVGLDGPNCGQTIPCGGMSTSGLDGTGPWIIGASNEASTSGTTDNLSLPLRGGSVDQLRISSAPRNF